MSFGGGGDTGGEARAEMAGANIFTRKAAVDRSHPLYGLDATLNRRGLTTGQAADIAFNPGSEYGTSGEKALAGAQIAIPGGTLLGGLRTLQMTQKVGAAAAADDSQRDDDTAPAVVAPKKKKGVIATGVKRTAAAKAPAPAPPPKGVTPKKPAPSLSPSRSVSAPLKSRGAGTTGRASTILTSYGPIDEAPVRRKALLGA